MTTLELSGLEAHNPLGFLAALGLLRVLDHEATIAGRELPRLGFVDQGTFVARLVTSHPLDEIIAIVLRDAAAQADNRALQFAYDTKGQLVPPNANGATRDLKPSPEAARELLDHAATADPRTASLAAAWFSELVQDNNGNTKPTALHFTAGQQAFLEMVEDLRAGLKAEHLREALEGPWLNTSPLPSLSWDASVARLYALRASNPAKERRGSVPGANWLAVLGVAFFPVVVQRGRLVTTGVTGGWKDSAFTWPVWSPAAEVSTVASLLRIDPVAWTQRERAAYGIETVFRSRILRSDQGGYGSFAPAEVIPASPRSGR
jgi:hypothetical protein